jgi:phosphoribosylformimino-5-aminoimidazole carboxamide ribonucleotide (ProFAR) isomerase
LDETLRVVRETKIPIIASGGVATVDYIRKLVSYEKEELRA